MLTTRQECTKKNLSSTAAISHKMQCASQFTPSEYHCHSYVMIDPVIYQAATVKKSSIIFLPAEESDLQKQTEGIKSSSHEVKVVSFPDGACNFFVSPLPLADIDKKSLPGNSKYTYVLSQDNKLLYLDRHNKNQDIVSLDENQLNKLRSELQLGEVKDGLIENLNNEYIKSIAHITKHVHCKAYYKEKKTGSVMSAVEAANSTMYQLLAEKLFSTCYAVRDENDQDIGIISMHLPHFKPMADKPLQNDVLEFTSLKFMAKSRSDEEKSRIMDVLIRIQNKIIPSLDRNPDPNDRYLWQFVKFIKNNIQYYFGSEFNAQNIKPMLDSIIKEGKAGINSLTLGALASLRKLLINRQQQINGRLDDYNHKKELTKLEKCIDELGLIILDEAAFYMEAMYQIDKQMKNNWVDVEAEIARHKPATTCATIKKGDHLIADVNVTYEDLQNFRIHYKQLICLFSRYFGMDPDGHKRNVSSAGLFIDGDLALCPLSFDLLDEMPSTWNKNANNFDFYLEDFLEFPNLKRAKYRYWPTQNEAVSRTFDTMAKATGSEASKNFYNDTDVDIFKDFAHSPVFCFQKYIQLAIQVLLNEKIYTACAELHMSDKLQMRDADGNRLPLINESGNYELGYLSDMPSLPGAGIIYIDVNYSDQKLYYKTIDRDGALQSGFISFNDLPPHFPLNTADIIEQKAQKEKYLQVILRETSRAGHTPPGWEQDVRSSWIKCLTQRSQNAKTELAMKSIAFKSLLEKHGDFIWQCVDEHFKSFLEMKRSEYTPDAIEILENAIDLEELKTQFYQLRTEILASQAQEFPLYSERTPVKISLS